MVLSTEYPRSAISTKGGPTCRFTVLWHEVQVYLSSNGFTWLKFGLCAEAVSAAVFSLVGSSVAIVSSFVDLLRLMVDCSSLLTSSSILFAAVISKDGPSGILFRV